MWRLESTLIYNHNNSSMRRLEGTLIYNQHRRIHSLSSASLYAPGCNPTNALRNYRAIASYIIQPVPYMDIWAIPPLNSLNNWVAFIWTPSNSPLRNSKLVILPSESSKLGSPFQELSLLSTTTTIALFIVLSSSICLIPFWHWVYVI
jgi:hypothetical protein